MAIHVPGRAGGAMKFGTMFSDVIVSLFQRPVTERYPAERSEAPERLRSVLSWVQENCTGCGMCAKDCPANAIELVVLDKKAKRFVMVYHVDRCTFCAQCVHTCMQNSLELLNDTWELAALSKDPFTLYFGDPQDVELVRSGALESGASSAEVSETK